MTTEHPITPPPEELVVGLRDCSDFLRAYGLIGGVECCTRAADLLERLSATGKPGLQVEPIPVSKRLPEAEDFDELGRVWWWYPETAGTLGYWQWEAGAMERQEDEQPSHWLPFHALPLPKEVE
jgi:hypothetical protein